MKKILNLGILTLIFLTSPTAGYCYFLHDASTPAPKQPDPKNSIINQVQGTPILPPSPSLAPTPPVPASQTQGQAVSSVLKEIAPQAVSGQSPAIPAVPVRSWNISPGSLQEQLSQWASQEGYQLIWRASWDLDMQASASFAGDFQTAIRDLFLGLHSAGHPIRLAIYPSNQVIEVIDQ